MWFVRYQATSCQLDAQEKLQLVLPRGFRLFTKKPSMIMRTNFTFAFVLYVAKNLCFRAKTMYFNEPLVLFQRYLKILKKTKNLVLNL